MVSCSIICQNQYHALSPVKLSPDNTPCICAGLLTQMKPHPSWYHAPSSVKPITKLYPLSNTVLTTHYTSMRGLLTPLKPPSSWLKHVVHEFLAGTADLFLHPFLCNLAPTCKCGSSSNIVSPRRMSVTSHGPPALQWHTHTWSTSWQGDSSYDGMPPGHLQVFQQLSKACLMSSYLYFCFTTINNHNT